MTIDFAIHSSDRFNGGDGLAIHFLDQEGEIDNFNPLFETGNFFAAKRNRKGFSVVLSTSEHNNLNQIIFVDDNMEGNKNNVLF